MGGGWGNTAAGIAATVPGGKNNEADGDNSFATGYRAKAHYGLYDLPAYGAFVWADSSNFDFKAVFNEFAVRATNGVRFVTAIDTSGNSKATTSIDPNGRLGVGTATPSDLFHGYSTSDAVIRLVGDGTGSAFSFEEYYPGVGGPGLYIKSARGSFTSPANLQVVDRMGQVIMAGYAGGAFRNVAAIEGWIDAGTVSSSSLPSYIRFLTTPNGSLARAERVRIDGNGNVGIGNTNPNNLLTMEASGGGYYSTSDHQWHNGSSMRYKENIREIASPLDALAELHGVIFDWKQSHGGRKDNLGFIAEQVGKALPSNVDWSRVEEGYADSYQLPAIVAILTESVKQLSTRLQELEAELRLR